MKKLFPSWRYHADGRSCIVKSQAESDALGEEWTDDLGVLKERRAAIKTVAGNEPPAPEIAEEPEPGVLGDAKFEPSASMQEPFPETLEEERQEIAQPKSKNKKR